MKIEAIVGLILSLQSPGRSIYSRVATDVYDFERPCDEDTILCNAPSYDGSLEAFARAENPVEGFERYITIALAVSEVAALETRTGRWPGKRDDLERTLVTIAYHESGFRRDVHSGVGPWARGDDGRSSCLGQILLKEGQITRRGYRADDLVGLDFASTARCVETMADYLIHAKRACRGSQAALACLFGTYGGVWAYSTDARVTRRVSTRRTKAARSESILCAVAEAWRDALGTDRVLRFQQPFQLFEVGRGVS